MDGDKHWSDDDRLYPSLSNSDDSPILSHRYDKARRISPYGAPRVEKRERRSTLTVLAKFFLFCTAMILFCVLLYIPVYNKASDQLSESTVAGWSMHTNRDTKIYVQPKNVTTIHTPRNICPRTSKDKLFLLIVVCSSTLHFERRVAIRETWGNYSSYHELSKIFQEVKQRYINYNYTYDLYSEQDKVNNVTRIKRDISSFSRLLPELAKALQDNLVNEKTEKVPEQRFEDEVMLPEFDMNEEMTKNTEPTYDYYDTNVMKIPPNGYEENPDLEKVLSMLKRNKNFRKMKEKVTLPDNTDSEYKVVFLLGLPANDNDSTIQNKIDEESEKYGDVIQEGFIDSYSNLTLKSIMMLKWITNNCNDSVRYILKTDDDMYINVPNLMDNLKSRAQSFDAKTKSRSAEEFLLIGDLICGAKPQLDITSKWYSPKYMYKGRVYPKYLSGTGYVLSADVARALYPAALKTEYFHLEDIFITGMCAGRAHPRIFPKDDPAFSYHTTTSEGPLRACEAYVRATEHRVAPDLMRWFHVMLKKPGVMDTCERRRLTKVASEMRGNLAMHAIKKLVDFLG